MPDLRKQTVWETPPNGENMDNNNSNLNTDSWEYSLEAILAEYAAQPEPETPQRPEDVRSREIVMEALSERIAASVENSTDFPEEISPRRAKRSLFRHNHTEKTPTAEPVSAPEAIPDAAEYAVPEPVRPAEPPVNAPAPEPAPVIAETPAPQAVPAEAPAADAAPKHLPAMPKAQPPKGTAIFNIADIIAEVRAAEAEGRNTAEIPVQLPVEAAEPEAYEAEIEAVNENEVASQAEAIYEAVCEAEDGAEVEAIYEAEAETEIEAPYETTVEAEAETPYEAEAGIETETAPAETEPEMPAEAELPPEAPAETEVEAEAVEAEIEPIQTMEFTGDEESAYAPEGEYALPEEEAVPEAKLPEKSRPSVLTSLMAALLIRRQQKHEKAKARAAAAAEERAEAEETPEASPKAASKYYLKSATPYKMRCFVAALLCLVLLYISWGLPLVGSMKNIRVCAGMCMVLELAVMLLGLDVFTHGFMSLCRGKPGLSSLAAVSCVCSVLDALIIMLGGPHRGLPYCGVSAITLCIALLGERLLCMGHARSFHTAAAAKNPTVITSEANVLKSDRVLLKSERGIQGFVNRAQEADAVELSYSALAPILLVAAPVLAFIATVCRRQAGDFFHCLSALTAVSASFSAFLSFTLPYSVAARRLAAIGAAIAGWAGCIDLGESRRIVVTDKDVFPEGNVLIDTIRILEGVYTDKVISYAGSVVAFSGSGLSSAFTDLMRRNGCSLQQVENFACHRGGGLTAIVRGEQVFVGNSSFMNLMGIRLPQSQMSQTSVFVAISGELVGVFSIRYTPTASVQEALVSLMRGRSAEPVFAIRDFNVTPYLIKQRFRMPTEGFAFPSFPERYRISGLSADEKSAPAAVTVRKGLAPYVEAAQAGQELYRGSRICLLLSLLCSVVGMILMFFLCAAGAYDSASAGNILLYLFLWLVPVVVVSLGLRR